MTVTEQLYQLQEIDTEIETGEQTLREKTGQLGDRRALDNALKKLESDREQFTELKRQQHFAELEVDSLTAKIAEVEGQLYGGKITNPKELSNLQHESITMKTKSDQLESEALEIIDRVEISEKELAAADEKFRQMESQWHRHQEQLTGEITQLKGDLDSLKKKRQRLAGDIEPEAVSLYESIRPHKQPPVARVERGICQICRISLSASALQRARGGQPVTCGSCGRILFVS